MKDSLVDFVEKNNSLVTQGYTKSFIAESLGYNGDHGSSWLAKQLRKAEKKGLHVLWNNKFNKVNSVKPTINTESNSLRDVNMAKVEVSTIPSKNPPINELWDKRVNEFNRVKANEDAKKQVTIKVDETKPTGLILFGDIHIDNPGCNIPKLLSDIKFAESTEGAYAITVGDLSDNWVGWLSKLYAKHETTKDQSLMLLENLISRVPWLFMVNGNHDLFQSIEINQYLSEKYNILEMDSEINVKLEFKTGNSFNIHSRHSYAGNSQWNTVHGQVKYAKMRGIFDIIVGGHTHSCGYNWVPIKDVHNNTYRISHCEQLGSYKVVDDYARDHGFEDTNITPSVMYILDPTTNDPNKKCIRFPDIEEGCKYLKYLRSKG